MSRRRSRRNKGNNNNFLSIILIVILIILLCNSLKTKDKKEEKTSKSGYDALAIVVGNVENSPKPNIESEKNIKKSISEVFYNTEKGDTPNIVMYSATSKPKTIDIDEKYFLGPAKNDIASNSNLNELIKGIDLAASTSPADAGCDYYAAITEASEYLKNYDNPLIIVYGSGLSDSGILNFAFDDLLNKTDNDNKYVTNMLSNNSKIIENEYSNTDLIWYGLGQTVGEQEELKEWDKVLKNAYSNALSYIGIDSKYNSIKLSSDAKSVKTDYDVAPTVIDNIKDGFKLSLTNRFASFEPDTANLLNYDEVKSMLKSYASKINKNNNLKIKLTGYQTECAVSNELSVKRASVIKNILVELGVDSNKISVFGVAGPQDNRVEEPRCGDTGVAVEHRTVILEVYE